MDALTVSLAINATAGLLRKVHWSALTSSRIASARPDLVITGPDGVRYVVELKAGDRVPRFGEIAQVERLAAEIEALDGGEGQVVPVLVTDRELSPAVQKAAQQAGVEVVVAKGDGSSVADTLTNHLIKLSRADGPHGDLPSWANAEVQVNDDGLTWIGLDEEAGSTSAQHSIVDPSRSATDTTGRIEEA